MNIPQIDAYIPASWLRYIGAVKTFATRSQFYFSAPQFMMIAILFYYQSNLIRGLFPTIYLWVGFLVVVGALTMGFEYVVMYPSEITFTSGQHSREERNPLYREVMAIHRRMDDLEPHLRARADGGLGQTTVVPACRVCGESGVSGTLNDQPVIECPECGDILYRKVRP